MSVKTLFETNKKSWHVMQKKNMKQRPKKNYLSESPPEIIHLWECLTKTTSSFKKQSQFKAVCMQDAAIFRQIWKNKSQTEWKRCTTWHDVNFCLRQTMGWFFFSFLFFWQFYLVLIYLAVITASQNLVIKLMSKKYRIRLGICCMPEQ